MFEIRPHRSGGWQSFEGPGVQPYWTEKNARQNAIDYAKGRTAHRVGEIRVYDAAGELAETIAFDERAPRL